MYRCRCCNKRTRETGDGESSCQLCWDCYDSAGVENECSDGCDPDVPDDSCRVCSPRAKARPCGCFEVLQAEVDEAQNERGPEGEDPDAGDCRDDAHAKHVKSLEVQRDRLAKEVKVLRAERDMWQKTAAQNARERDEAKLEFCRERDRGIGLLSRIKGAQALLAD
jgi:hypothetical protein